jgi:tetratricopeptide (TPR) repeat protein
MKSFGVGLSLGLLCFCYTQTAGDDAGHPDAESDFADAEFYMESAAVALGQGNLREALSLLLAAVEVQPSRYALGRAACVSNALGDWEGTVSITTRAIELAGKGELAPEIFMVRGLGRSAMGQHDEAVGDLEVANAIASNCTRAFAMTWTSAESEELLDPTECKRIQAFGESSLSDLYELLGDPARALTHLELSFELAESIAHKMRGSNRTCLGCSDDFVASKKERHVSLLLRVAKDETLAQSAETEPTSIRALPYIAAALYVKPLDVTVWQEAIACLRGFGWHYEQLRASNTLMRFHKNDYIIRTILAHAMQVSDPRATAPTPLSHAAAARGVPARAHRSRGAS